MKKLRLLSLYFLFGMTNLHAQNQHQNNYQVELDNLNQFLLTFNDGYFGSFSVEKDSIYNRLKGGNYWYRFKASSIYGAEINPDSKSVILQCAKESKRCIMPSYGSINGGDNLNSYINYNRNPFNYAVLANLMNKFIYALKKQPIPTELVYDETKYIKTTNAEIDAIKNANTPLDKAVAEFNLAFKDFPYGSSEYIKNISLNENRNKITINFLKSKPQILLERIEDMQFIDFGKSEPSIRFNSNNKGYCYCSNESDCSDTYTLYSFKQSEAENFYLYFGNIIDAWKTENKIKSKETTYSEKYAKMKSPDFKWEIKSGKKFVLPEITKANKDYKTLKDLVGTIVKSWTLRINKDFETYSGLIKTSDDRLISVTALKITPESLTLNSRSLGTQDLGNDFVETKEKSVYQSTYFNFNKKIYQINEADNTIEEIDFQSGLAKTIIEKELGEKIVSVTSTNRYIYFATTNQSLYTIYYFNPSTNEIKELSNTQANDLKYKANNSTGEKYSIYLTGFSNRIAIQYSVTVANNSTGFINANNKHYTVFDKDLTLKRIHYRNVMNNPSNKSSFNYYGVVSGSFGFTNERVLLDIYKDENGKYHQLATAIYNPNSASYDSLKTYKLLPETMKVDEIFEAKGEVYAITSFWDDPSSKTKRRRLFKLNEKGQLTTIGDLGKGEESDFARIFISGDDIYIKSFSSIYEYTITFNFLKEVVAYSPSVIIKTSIYPTTNGSFIFEKFTTNPLSPAEKMIYDWRTKAAVPITIKLNSNQDIKNINDPYSLWINAENNNYVIKYTNEKYALYKLNVTNNIAEQIQMPVLGNLKFKEIVEYRYFIDIKYIWLKVKYLDGEKEIEKYLVYKCQ